MTRFVAYWLARAAYRVARWAHAIDTPAATAAWKDVWEDDFLAMARRAASSDGRVP